jgi:hypothetical protein
MPLAITAAAKSALPLSLATAGRKLRSTALKSIVAAYLLATSGCIALSIPSKRFHDPQDRGGLLGDFRGGGSETAPMHAGEGDHFMDDSAELSVCSEECCAASPECEAPYDGFDEAVGLGLGGRHQKAPDVPWPRYHPVPTRPVFTGYPGF